MLNLCVWSEVKWRLSHTWNLCSAFNPSKCTHSGQPMLQCPGSSCGIEGLFSPPTENSWRTWDSNMRPSGYKSDSLSIRPRLPLNKSYNKQTYPPLICVLPNNHLDRDISFLRRPSVTVLDSEDGETQWEKCWCSTGVFLFASLKTECQILGLFSKECH